MLFFCKVHHDLSICRWSQVKSPQMKNKPHKWQVSRASSFLLSWAYPLPVDSTSPSSGKLGVSNGTRAEFSHRCWQHSSGHRSRLLLTELKQTKVHHLGEKSPSKLHVSRVLHIYAHTHSLSLFLQFANPLNLLDGCVKPWPPEITSRKCPRIPLDVGLGDMTLQLSKARLYQNCSLQGINVPKLSVW